MKKRIATFAAGCFWGVENAFIQSGKVLSTRVGYMGGITEHPTYQQVSMGNTGHAEAVQVEYHERDLGYVSIYAIFFVLFIHNVCT